jgi:hypothetical protein
MFGNFQEERINGVKGHLALTLGRDVERRIAVFRERKGEQRSKEWHRFL